MKSLSKKFFSIILHIVLGYFIILNHLDVLRLCLLFFSAANGSNT